MRACVMVEPQEGMSYEQLLHVARRARELGLEGLFRSDHYQSLSGASAAAPQTDAWATLAGLARDVADGVLGTLVSPVTFRHPGQLAKVVATVSHMSAGPTIELGLGTGWNPMEHTAFGFPFGTFGDRFAILEEYVQVVKGLLSGEAFTFTGTHYQIDNAGNRPAARDVRIVIGGMGPKRTPRLAARFGDELNLVGVAADKIPERITACRAAMESAGRDPGSVVYSWMGPFAIGDRAGKVPVRYGAQGSEQEVTDFYGALKDAGIERVMLQHLLIEDDEHLAAVSELVAKV